MRRRIWGGPVLLASIALGAGVAPLVVLAQDRTTNQLTVLRRAYDKLQVLRAPSLSEAALKGRTLWVQRCAYCHDGVGTPTYQTLGPWLDAETVQPNREALVRKKIATSSARMPGFQYTLQPKQVDQLITFLKSVTPDQKPTPAQLSKVPPAASAEP